MPGIRLCDSNVSFCMMHRQLFKMGKGHNGSDRQAGVGDLIILSFLIRVNSRWDKACNNQKINDRLFKEENQFC